MNTFTGYSLNIIPYVNCLADMNIFVDSKARHGANCVHADSCGELKETFHISVKFNEETEVYELNFEDNENNNSVRIPDKKMSEKVFQEWVKKQLTECGWIKTWVKVL